MSHQLSPITFGSPSWDQPQPRGVPPERGGSSHNARPFPAALLMAAAGAVVVGGCFMAARLGGAWGSAAALAGFAGYLFLFARGLDRLPVDWNSWRVRKLREYTEETEEREDRNQGNQGNPGGKL